MQKSTAKFARTLLEAIVSDGIDAVLDERDQPTLTVSWGFGGNVFDIERKLCSC